MTNRVVTNWAVKETSNRLQSQMLNQSTVLKTQGHKSPLARHGDIC